MTTESDRKCRYFLSYNAEGDTDKSDTGKTARENKQTNKQRVFAIMLTVTFGFCKCSNADDV